MDAARMLQESFEQLGQVREAMSREQGRIFERVSETGLCRVVVDLDGNLIDVVFLRNDVFGLDEPAEVAVEILKALKAARAEAAEAAARVVEQVLPPMG
jgi:hypothetical protein